MNQKQALKEGWCLIDNGGYYQIQKDDDSDLWDGDFEAYVFVRAKADDGSAYHKEAIRLHGVAVAED